LHASCLAVRSNTKLDVVVVFRVESLLCSLDVLASEGPVQACEVVLLGAVVALAFFWTHLSRSSFWVPAITASIRTVIGVTVSCNFIKEFRGGSVLEVKNLRGVGVGDCSNSSESD